MGVVDNSIIHVQDISHKSASLTSDDFLKNENYIIPDEKYSARKGKFLILIRCYI